MSIDNDSSPEPRPRAVLDPRWEVQLRAGQEAEGDQGSVEDELAIIHLLRHARAPQALDDASFDRVWGDLDAELDEAQAAQGWRAWLRRPWMLVGGASMAAAAAAVLVLVWADPADPVGDEPNRVAEVERPAVDSGGMAAAIEAQFALLEPGARAKVERSIDRERESLRGDLVAAALRADGRTMGGAP